MRRRLAAVSLVLALLAGLAASSAASPGVAWFDRGLHVVGGPVAAGGRVLVLASNPDRSVDLEAIEPKTGSVAWKLPWGFSDVTAGVAAGPAASGQTALALIPDASTDRVWLEGVDISTGSVRWRLHNSVLVTDPPGSCPEPLGKRAFCLVDAAFAPPFPPNLVALSPATGNVLASVTGAERGLGTDVYQVVAVHRALGSGVSRFVPVNTPTLVGVRTPGGVQWTKQVASLFGRGYSPDFGWNFDRFGSVDVAQVDKGSGHTLDLSAFKTLGLAASNGKTLWADRGAFECGGLAGLRAEFLCVMTGIARFSLAGNVTVSKGATGALEGFDAGTGRVKWRVPVGHLAALLLGDVELADAHDMLVWSSKGRQMVVDLRNGDTRSPTQREAFWCEKFNIFKIRPPRGIGPTRVGSSFVTPCDASGHPVAAAARPPGSAVATVSGMTVWAAPSGLQGRRSP